MTEADWEARSRSQVMGIAHRPPTRAEALKLHQELKTTPDILGYTVRELERLSDVHVALAGQEFAGACWSVDLALGWTEIAAFYVLPEFRGMGSGERLFRAAWDRTQGCQRHVYVLRRNPKVVGWMRELGMTVGGRLWRAAGRPLVHAVVHDEPASRCRECAQAQGDREVSAAGAGDAAACSERGWIRKGSGGGSPAPAPALRPMISKNGQPNLPPASPLPAAGSTGSAAAR